MKTPESNNISPVATQSSDQDLKNTPPEGQNPSLNNQQQQQVIQFLTQQQISAGPLPISKEFEGYEKVLPGAANRILIMAEKEQESRVNIAKQTIALQNKQLDNLKSIENRKTLGDIIKKSTSVIGIIGIAIIAILSKQQNWLPYSILLAVIAAPEAKTLIERLFKSE